MSWLCKAGPTDLHLDTVPLIANEFRRVDQKTKQIYTEVLFDESSFDLKKFEDWRRIKIETVNTREILKKLKEGKEHFIDQAFPHNNSRLSKEHFEGEVVWKRVREVVENAVYSKEQTIKTLEKTKLNRRQFEKALILISRSSPTLFKELLSKSLNPEGLYEYKLFRNGYITNVVIDDYIPTHEGFPLFIGPARQNEVYPMLLEKAIAKVCGSYQEIPETAEELLEIVFCGPVKTKSVQQLRENGRLGEQLRECVTHRLLTVLVSKREPKIRNYGLNENEVYHVINRHMVDVSAKKEDVYELVSETKLSAWNGRFALNDQVWGNIDSQRKLELYQQIKANRSFLMGEADVGKHFEELLIFESMDIGNKDWCENQSDNSFPSFTTFQVQEADRIFIRVSTSSRIRQTLILVRQTSPKQYEFVGSNFDQNTYKVELSIELVPGKYILAVLHEWFLNNHGKYFVFLSSEHQVSLRKGGVVDNGFLLKALTSYEEQLLAQEADNKLYKMRIEIEKFGLAWLSLRPTLSKTKSLKIDINHEMLKSEGWIVLDPYSGIPTVNFTSQNAVEETMIVMEKRDIDHTKKYHFPVAAFKLKE